MINLRLWNGGSAAKLGEWSFHLGDERKRPWGTVVENRPQNTIP